MTYKRGSIMEAYCCDWIVKSKSTAHLHHLFIFCAWKKKNILGMFYALKCAATHMAFSFMSIEIREPLALEEQIGDVNTGLTKSHIEVKAQIKASSLNPGIYITATY
ncbi:hypothetical protein ACJX0J_018416, partial [Zea mays]